MIHRELSDGEPQTPAGSRSLPSFLPIVLLLFFGSGCAALIYEIIWFQMLQLVIGSTAVSIGVLLGTYMGGMCLGSIALSRVVSPRRHPLRIFALLELGIGVIGILILPGLPYAAQICSTYTGGGLMGIVLRGLFAAACLLPPTLLMGATLPAISRWIETTPRGVSWLGFLYGSNIAGGVFGCLLAGFYLLRVHDVTTATYVAAAVNGTVAFSALILTACAGNKQQTGAGPRSASRAVSGDTSASPGTIWPVYVTIGLSGATALGAEVVWTRLLSLSLGGTVYTFSIILAVFLLGLGIGSGIAAMLRLRKSLSSFALGGCQWLLTGAILWTAYLLTLPKSSWPIESTLSLDPWQNCYLDLVRCIWVLLPATLLWGASFPLALAAGQSSQDPAKWVGRIYAANTVGGILGGVSFSLVFIPLMGTQQSQRLLIGLSAFSALLMLVPLWRFGQKRPSAAVAGGLLFLATLVLLPFYLGKRVPPLPGGLVAYGRHWQAGTVPYKILFVGEGMNSSIAVSEMSATGVRSFHVAGKVQASTSSGDMRAQRMLGDMPALIQTDPRSVLIVGCGAGVTAGSFTVFPTIRHITICELEPLIPKTASRYFSKADFGVVTDPRTHIVLDDARHYILTTTNHFDVITSDPIDPWVKGSAALYTREYFELVKRHLNPGGVATQYVPLYESDASTVQSEIATFFDVFPDGTIWRNDQDGYGYDLVLTGQAGPTRINLDEIQDKFGQPDYSALVASLEDVGFHSAKDVFATYAGRAKDLAPWLKNAQINRDRNLRLQYLAGLHPNLQIWGVIYEAMVTYRKYPDGLFEGSDESLRALKSALTPAH